MSVLKTLLTSFFVLTSLVGFAQDLSSELSQQNDKDKIIVFDPNATPLWTYSFLRRTTIDFLNNARGLEEKMFNLQLTKNSFEERLLLLSQAVGMAELNQQMAQNAVDLAELEVNGAEGKEQLAQIQLSNKVDQLKVSKESLEFIKKKQKAIQKKAMWGNLTSLGINAAATFVGGGLVGSSVGAGANSVLERPGDIGGSISNLFFNTQKDQDAIQNRQTEDQIEQIKRDTAEYFKMFKLAKIEVAKANKSKDRASLGQNIANQELQDAQERLKLALNQQDALDLETLIDDVQKIQKTYMLYAHFLAKMTERAYELAEVDKVEIIKPLSEYNSGSSARFLIGDQLLLDLNTIEYRRISTKKQKRNNCTYVVSLNNRNPFELQGLRERGIMQFDITQMDLDVAFPGTYSQLINSIDVQVIALTTQDGIKGQLSKEGLSWVKIPDFIAGDASVEDWLEYIPSDYRLQLLKDPDETLIMPIQRSRVPSADEEGLKGIFEGRGVCGVYTLELPKYSNSFNYNTIIDVIITVNFSAYFDYTLKGMIETELCERESATGYSNQRELFFSSFLSSPDDWYNFHNPTPDSLSQKQRILPLRIYQSDIPGNHLTPKIDYLSITTIDDEGRFVPLNFSVTNSSLNPDVVFLEKGGSLREDILRQKLNWVNPSNFHYAISDKDTVFVKTDPLSFRNLLLLDTTNNVFRAKTEQVWLIKIEADSNHQFAKKDPTLGWIMDEKKLSTLVDINWGFGYNFKTSFCELKPRILAEMDVDSIQNGVIARGRKIGLADSTQVPYFYTSIGAKRLKIYQTENVWREWETDRKTKEFVESTTIRNDDYADLIPFYSLIKKRSSQEIIELTFDIKEQKATYYFNPTFLSLEISKSGTNRRMLAFKIDTSQLEDNPLTDLWALPKPITLHQDSVTLVFRYVDLSTSRSKSILDIRYRKGGKLVRIFSKPLVFTRWRSRQATNFAIKVHRGDIPPKEGNFILKAFKAMDLARF